MNVLANNRCSRLLDLIAHYICAKPMQAKPSSKPSGPLNFCCPYSNSFLGGVPPQLAGAQIRGHKQVRHVPSLVHYPSMALNKFDNTY